MYETGPKLFSSRKKFQKKSVSLDPVQAFAEVIKISIFDDPKMLPFQPLSF